MIFKDYYKILGLNTNKVSTEQIRASFREQAKKYHPDVNDGNTTEERFKDINEAYRVLSSAVDKRKYDRMWNTHISKKQSKEKYEESKRSKDSLSSDFFNMFFGTPEKSNNDEEIKLNKKVPIKGDNVETEINISIEEAFYGLEKKISLRTINRQDENIYN